jgi:uncharacterized protein YprB with RNaseH-like and TPR domain
MFARCSLYWQRQGEPVEDLKSRLEELRLRVAEVDRRWRERRATPREPIAVDLPGGRAVENGVGRYWEREALYSRLGLHGAFEISAMEEWPGDLLGPISEGRIAAGDPRRWAFLDTETTGLAGGAGTLAFLAGVGRIAGDGFRVRQFFLRDYDEEPAMLAALAEHLAGFDVVVTYNGAAFDVPLLETRYRLARIVGPFASLAHLDLLAGARRLWKLRLASCRLADLESRILGHEREDDIAGALIPYVFFEYQRTGRALHLAAVFRHNATDILSLAALTGVVSRAFTAPGDAEGLHPAEMTGLARWLERTGRAEVALDLYRRALERGLDDELAFRTQWDAALIEKKLGRAERALADFGDLAAARNPFQRQALEEIAKHYEHRRRDPARALEFTEAALRIAEDAELRRRQARLRRRLEPGLRRRSEARMLSSRFRRR